MDTGNEYSHVEVNFLRNDMVQAVLFLIALSFIGTIQDLPWSLYKTYGIEEKYGFNKTDAKTFVLDMIK